MGIVFRQSAKNLIVTATGAVLSVVVMWMATTYVSKRGYGFMGAFTTYAVALGQFLLFGLNNTVSVYIHQYAEQPERKKLLFTWSLVVPTIIAIIFTSIYVFAKPFVLQHFQIEDRPYIAKYFLLLPLFIACFMYLIIFEQYLQSQMKVAVSAFVKDVLIKILNIVLIVLFALNIISFDAWVIGSVLIYLVPIAILVAISRKEKDFGLSTKWNEFSKEEYKELLHFSWAHFLLTVTILLMGYMDTMLIPFYDRNGFDSTAVYRNAGFLITFLLIPQKAMMQATFTAIARAFAINDLTQARDLYNRASNNIFLATVGLAIVLCANVGNFVALLPKGYEAVSSVFLILFVGNMVNIAAGINDQVLSIAKYYRFNVYLSFLLLVCLFVFLRILIPLYGVHGAALATSLTYILFNAIKTIFIRKRLSMSPLSKGTFLTIVAAAPAMLASLYMPKLFGDSRNMINILTDATVRSLLAITIYAAMVLWLKPSKDLVTYMASIRQHKRLF